MAKGMKGVLPAYGPVTEDVPLVGAYLRSLANGHHALLGDALAHVLDSRGKWLRPALVLLSGKLGCYHRDRLVTLAAAIEVVHTATLVHDDTIDEALTRRGIDTVNAVWDGKVAILLGDFLFAQSAELATQLDNVRIMSLLSQTVMAMSSGELQQYASTRSREIDENDYLQRITGKTASLFAMCCEGAAILSEQSENHIKALRAYGTNLGLAFQIADDVLDFVGDERTLGKPAGSDLRQGTITLPAILLAEKLAEDAPLRGDLRGGTNLPTVLRAVRESGALDAARERAREYAGAARSALSIFPDTEARGVLLELAEQVVSRDY